MENRREQGSAGYAPDRNTDGILLERMVTIYQPS